MIANQRYANDFQQAYSQPSYEGSITGASEVSATREVRLEAAVKRAFAVMESVSSLRQRLQGTADLLDGASDGVKVEGPAKDQPAPYGTLNILDGVVDGLEREASRSHETLNRLQRLIG